jgi:hypothetical protein
VSIQITILKVLAGHPEGRASLAELRQFTQVLTCSGPDWSQRIKRLAARAPGLDIFSSGYVLRETSGWIITTAGRDFLTSIEGPAAKPRLELPPAPVANTTPVDLGSNVIQLADHRDRRGRLDSKPAGALDQLCVPDALNLLGELLPHQH